MSESYRTQSPWHLWIIAIVSLLWNAMGAFDYVMTQTKNEPYMSNFTPEQLTYFYSFPSWVVATWAVAVWAGVFGSIFLLFRKSLAVWMFLLSMLCMVATAIYNYVLSNGMEVIGDTVSILFTIVIFLIAVLLLVYANNMRARNIIV